MRLLKRVVPLIASARIARLPLIAGLIACAGVSAVLAQTPDTSQGSSSSTVSGRVVNANSGLPIPRALVQIGSTAVFTDHEGKFSLADVPAGSSFVEVAKPGYFTSPEQTDPPGIQISAADAAHTLELYLYPEALLTGSVVAQDGSPLAQITVTARKVTSSGADRHLQVFGSTQTDSHGEFRLPVPAGDYQLTTQFVAVSPETGMTILPAIAPEGGAVATFHIASGEQQQFQLRPRTGLAHTVTLAVPGLSDDRFSSLVVTTADGASWQMGGQPDPETGRVSLRLPAGSYLLEVNSDGSELVASGQTRLSVPDHDLAGVQVQLSPVAPIPVEVVVDVHASAAATAPTAQQLGLELLPEQQQGRSSRENALRLQSRGGRPPSFLPSPGRYHLVSSARGSWYIQSAIYGGSDVLGSTISVAAGTGSAPLQLTVSNVTGSLQGQVTSGDAPVSLWVELLPSFPSANPIISLHSAADGSFSAQNLPPGGYSACVLQHRTSADLLDASVRNSLGARLQPFTIQAGVQTTLKLDGKPAS